MNTETFASQLMALSYNNNPHELFEDFLSFAICALNKSIVEDNLLIEPALEKCITAGPELDFDAVLTALVKEMDNRKEHDCGNDVLGEFVETHLYPDDWEMVYPPYAMTHTLNREVTLPVLEKDIAAGRPVHAADWQCGSGRGLVSLARLCPEIKRYCGLVADPIDAKIAIINLFMQRVSEAEILCAYFGSEKNTFHSCYAFSASQPAIRSISYDASELWQFLNTLDQPALYLTSI